MNTFELFRMKLMSDNMSKAVRTADKIEKKIQSLELNGLFRVKGKYVTLCDKGTAFGKIRQIELNGEAKKWLVKDEDIIKWQTAVFSLLLINDFFDLDLELAQDWDIAMLRDKEPLFFNVMLSINDNVESWTNLDPITQREVMIIFDAIDNSKYFIHSINRYFTDPEGNDIDQDYKNHLLARL